MNINMLRIDALYNPGFEVSPKIDNYKRFSYHLPKAQTVIMVWPHECSAF
jgi:hypothetical protein